MFEILGNACWGLHSSQVELLVKSLQFVATMLHAKNVKRRGLVGLANSPPYQSIYQTRQPQGSLIDPIASNNHVCALKSIKISISMLFRISHTNTSEMLCAIINNTLHSSLFLLNFSNFLLALLIGTTRLCICIRFWISLWYRLIPFKWFIIFLKLQQIPFPMLRLKILCNLHKILDKIWFEVATNFLFIARHTQVYSSGSFCFLTKWNFLWKLVGSNQCCLVMVGILDSTPGCQHTI